MERFKDTVEIKTGTYIYHTYSTGKENTVEVEEIKTVNGKKYAIAKRNGSPVRLEIRLHETFNYEYFVPMQKKGAMQNVVNIVWDWHRVK